MPRIATEPQHRGSPTLALLTVALASLGLAACGSSSSGTSAGSTPTATRASSGATTPSTAPTSTTPTGTTPTSTAPSITTNAQFKHLYDCLVRAGIKLPPINELGKAKIDTTTAHYQAALKKCERELHG